MDINDNRFINMNNKKQDNMISSEIRYKKTEKGMMITEYYGNDSYVVLPDEIEGECRSRYWKIMHFPEIFQLRKYGAVGT